MEMNIMQAATYLDGLIYEEHAEEMQAVEQRRRLLDQINVQKRTLTNCEEKLKKAEELETIYDEMESFFAYGSENTPEPNEGKRKRKQLVSEIQKMNNRIEALQEKQKEIENRYPAARKTFLDVYWKYHNYLEHPQDKRPKIRYADTFADFKMKLLQEMLCKPSGCWECSFVTREEFEEAKQQDWFLAADENFQGVFEDIYNTMLEKEKEEAWQKSRAYILSCLKEDCKSNDSYMEALVQKFYSNARNMDEVMADYYLNMSVSEVGGNTKSLLEMGYRLANKILGNNFGKPTGEDLLLAERVIRYTDSKYDPAVLDTGEIEKILWGGREASFDYTKLGDDDTDLVSLHRLKSQHMIVLIERLVRTFVPRKGTVIDEVIEEGRQKTLGLTDEKIADFYKELVILNVRQNAACRGTMYDFHWKDELALLQNKDYYSSDNCAFIKQAAVRAHIVEENGSNYLDSFAENYRKRQEESITKTATQNGKAKNHTASQNTSTAQTASTTQSSPTATQTTKTKKQSNPRVKNFIGDGFVKEFTQRKIPVITIGVNCFIMLVMTYLFGNVIPYFGDENRTAYMTLVVYVEVVLVVGIVAALLTKPGKELYSWERRTIGEVTSPLFTIVVQLLSLIQTGGVYFWFHPGIDLLSLFTGFLLSSVLIILIMVFQTADDERYGF